MTGSRARARKQEVSPSRRREVPQPAKIFDPVARALEVIGDRWTLVLVRQLLIAPRGFQDLRMRTGIAPRVLSGRLRQLVSDGFVEQVQVDGRPLYALSERGRSLEPIVASIALWWVHHGIHDLDIDPTRFTETSPQSILESLPFLLREDKAREANVTFEIRLTGTGGGVWTVAIRDGHCEVRPGFADHADVRYTAEARVWCGVALGLADARDMHKRGLLTKDGAEYAMNEFFHQIARDASGFGLDEDGSKVEPRRVRGRGARS